MRRPSFFVFYRLKVDIHRSMSPHSFIAKHTATVAVSSKRKIERVQYVQDLELEQVAISKTHNPKSKIRSFNVSNGPDPNDRVLVQLDAGGRIPSKFGVDVNDNGKTYLRLTVPDADELTALGKIASHLANKVVAGKGVFWPKLITEKAVRSNFSTTFVTPPVAKTDNSGGFWDGSVKMSVDLTDKGSLRSGVSIVDHDGTPVDVADLPGRQYETALFELGCLYILGQKSGITKKLVRLQLKQMDTPHYEEVSFLPKRQKTH